MAIDFAIRKPTDIGVEGGLIAAIERGFVCDAAEHDAGGKLVCGGLIETCRAALKRGLRHFSCSIFPWLAVSA
jgi:dihydroorotase-like cyclic amidohydrolase